MRSIGVHGHWRATLALVLVVGVTLGASLLTAQGTLGQLGLTEAAARNFVLDEIKRPAQDRRSPIAIAGTRAFLKLPRSARGAAATALFAWAKAYVNSPVFAASYSSYRRETLPQGARPVLSVDERLKKELDEQLAGIEQARQLAASLPPAGRQQLLDKIKETQATLTNPDTLKVRRAIIEAELQQQREREAVATRQAEEKTPADPQTLFARRLREFLDATSDVNFSARTISLTGGVDGIEFVDRADRHRHWVWREAAIVGPEATAAARAAAHAWLQEIER